MRFLHNLYYFLGSITFAICLISSAAIFVIIGTILEAKTESHQFASQWVYTNFFFKILLWGFFLNILTSTVHRWPFKLKQIPFITTHLGLLMILAGLLIKSYFGTQGSMAIMEGSGSHEIFLPDTYSLRLEQRQSDHSFRSKVNYISLNNLPLTKEGLHLEIVNYVPHSSEQWESWIKGSELILAGFPGMKVFDFFPTDNAPIPLSSQIHLKNREWDLIALRTNHVEEAAKQVYLRNLCLKISDQLSEEPWVQLPLKTALKKGVNWQDAQVKCKLDFNYSSLTGFEQPTLYVNYTNHQLKRSEKIAVPLDGAECLINRNLLTPYLGNCSIAIDFVQKPTLLFIQDFQEDLYLFVFGPNGEVYTESFLQNQFNTLLVYDQGFGGYAVQAKLPSFFLTRKEKEIAKLTYLSDQLRLILKSNPDLCPPLKMLQHSCEDLNLDFVHVFANFLDHWNKVQGWLYPKTSILPANLEWNQIQFDWRSMSPRDQKICYWMSVLFQDIDQKLQQGEDLLTVLKKKQWPFLQSIEEKRATTGICTPEESAFLLTMMSQQMISIVDQLPPADSAQFFQSSSYQAHFFSAYLRAYGISLNSMMPPDYHQQSIETQRICLECPLTLKQEEQNPLVKLENNRPTLTLLLDDGKSQERISLFYDPYGMNLRLPALNGKYLLRFQSQFHEIPYHIRLRDARQISYPNSSQPFSFECDLLITDRRDSSKKAIEKTLSMNHVYETWDGYRFYLASLAPPHETSVQNVQLVVNHDPGKFYFTYPGAMILSLGIILLFWFKPFGSNH